MNGASTRVITLEGRCRGDRCGRAGAGDVMDGLRLALLTGDYEGRPHRRQVKARRCRELLPSPLWGVGVGRCGTSMRHGTPPTPTLPHKGEGVRDRPVENSLPLPSSGSCTRRNFSRAAGKFGAAEIAKTRGIGREMAAD